MIAAAPIALWVSERNSGVPHFVNGRANPSGSQVRMPSPLQQHEPFVEIALPWRRRGVIVDQRIVQELHVIERSPPAN